MLRGSEQIPEICDTVRLGGTGLDTPHTRTHPSSLCSARLQVRPMRKKLHSQIEKMTIAERVALAQEKTRRVVDHLLYLLELHENNAIVLYSPTLSAQIPLSFAAHAFNVF